MREFLLYVGTAHDAELRRQVADECRIRGIEVISEDGPFGTVEVRHEAGRHNELSELPGVSSICAVDDGCPYGQNDCESNNGGVCICGLPRD